MPAGSDPTAYAAFRPRRARVVALVVGVVAILFFGLVGAFVTGAGPADHIGIAGFGVAIAWLMWRYASVAAVPSESGLRVRNLMTTRTLDWAEVVGVHLLVGAPWVSLDLDDGDTLPVMAIQKADGERGRAEASRLSALVAAHESPEPPRR
jgi:hypothetical protein